MWLTYDYFKCISSSKWGHNQDLIEVTKNFIPKVKDWNVNIFGHIRQRKRKTASDNC